MRDCDRCGRKIQYGALRERCTGYLEGLRACRKREYDIEREFFNKSIDILRGIDSQVANMYIDAILGMEG